MSTDPSFTSLLESLSGGNRTIVDALMPAVYDELQMLARQKLRGERSDHTLDTSALVHEAYEKLVEQDRMTWKNRAHFLGVAALSMRRILINYAHRKDAQKRGGGAVHVGLEDDVGTRPVHTEELIDLDEALKKLERLHERPSQVVTLRYFGGLTQQETAEALGVSVATVRRDWRLARAWLSRELREGSDDATEETETP